MSEWPTPLLMDEVWLSARREMVVSFERKGLWQTPADYKENWRQQLNKGNQLVAALLPEILGQKDFDLLSSEVLFGKYNFQFKRKLPFSLAFGQEMGSGLHHCFQAASEYHQAVSELCSLFNLGISLFDFLLDQPGNRSGFAAVFNADFLTAMQQGHTAVDRKKKQTDEARVLLKIIIGFYQRLFILTKEMQQSPKIILDLLKKAYHAEMASTTVTSFREQRQVAKQKSVLPFEIMGALANLSARAGNQQKNNQFSRELGLLFWKVDDLADMVQDFQAKQPNSLLMDAAGPTPDALALHSTLQIVLEKAIVTKTVRRLVRHTDDLVTQLYGLAKTSTDSFRFRQALLFYIKDWLN